MDWSFLLPPSFPPPGRAPLIRLSRSKLSFFLAPSPPPFPLSPGLAAEKYARPAIGRSPPFLPPFAVNDARRPEVPF